MLNVLSSVHRKNKDTHSIKYTNGYIHKTLIT